VLYFRSDGSRNDWGFKVTVTGIKKDVVVHVMDRENYPELVFFDYNSAIFRHYYHLIILLKVNLVQVLNYVNFNEKSTPGSLLWMVLKLRHLIPFNTKNAIILKALVTSGSPKTLRISIDRTNAKRFIENGRVDHDGTWSVFSQLYRALLTQNRKNLMYNTRCFKVDLGEGAIDAGGPYREVWTNLAEDLMSSYLFLLVPSPNQRLNSGENQDTWVLNPHCSSPLHIKMLQFLGNLMGMAIRSHHYLEINLSSACWKLIADEAITVRDLTSHDDQLLSTILRIRANSAEELHRECGIGNFTMISSITTKEVELHPGGVNTIVTMENKDLFLDEYQRCVCDEMRVAALHIRQGIVEIVPKVVLLLTTGDELEKYVCGDPFIDLAELKSRTSFEGWNTADAVKQFFWSMMEEFSQKELSMLIRFSWGRSRLPKTDYQFKVTKLDCSNANQRLPEAHTCFFQICIPPYSSKLIAAEKIKYAIHSLDMAMS
jgi:hypothetical protein